MKRLTFTMALFLLTAFVGSAAHAHHGDYDCTNEEVEALLSFEEDKNGQITYHLTSESFKQAGIAVHFQFNKTPWRGALFAENGGGAHLYFKNWENRLVVVLQSRETIDLVCKKH